MYRDRSAKVPETWHAKSQDRRRDASLGLRKKVEMLFARLKRILKLDRLRLRGANGARDEFLLAATAQNLRKLAKLILGQKLKPAQEQKGSAIDRALSAPIGST
jgi:hypothetical protein